MTAREQRDAGGTRIGMVEREVEPLDLLRRGAGLQKEFKDRRQGSASWPRSRSAASTTPRCANELNEQSLMAGLDGWTFLDKNQTWVVSGWSARRTSRATRDAHRALQQNSRHYFQRPDADHVDVDAGRTGR